MTWDKLSYLRGAARRCWLVSIALVFAPGPVACDTSSTKAFSAFREEVPIAGSCGSGPDQLAFFESDIGTYEGPTTLCGRVDSSIWIADSYNHCLKRFDGSGHVVQSIRLDSAGAIDDMSCDNQGRILFRDWKDRESLTMIDSLGSVVRKFPLPQGKASGGTISLVTLGETSIYALYMDSTAEIVGLRYDIGGELVEVRKQDLRLWAETAGRYCVPDSAGESGDAWGSFDPRRIQRADGSLFVTDSRLPSPWMHAIGLDSSGNLYLSFWKNKGGDVRSESFVAVYSPTGRNLAVFPVQRFADIIADSHFPKVAPNGDVYILTVRDDLTEWMLYRYTSR